MEEKNAAVESAAQKLKSEISKDQNEATLQGFLVKRMIAFMEMDPSFAHLVLQEGKTLKKCVEYIYEEAKKEFMRQNGGKGQSGCLPLWHDVVLEMGRAYYERDDAEIERQKAEEQEKKRKEEAKRAEEMKLRLMKNKEEAKAKEIAKSGQLSLFDLGGIASA